MAITQNTYVLCALLSLKFQLEKNPYVQVTYLNATYVDVSECQKIQRFFSLSGVLSSIVSFVTFKNITDYFINDLHFIRIILIIQSIYIKTFDPIERNH